jgi:xanthine dehydrogenase/oxidase
MAQIASEALNVPMDLIRVPETNTRAIGNATSTGASTGADLNGVAVQKAGTQLRKRLEEFCLHEKEKNGEQHCIDLGIAFWKHKEGWRKMVKVKGSAAPSLMWANVVNQAWQHRIDLTSEAFYKTPHTSQLSSKHPQGRPYFYYTYGVSCSEVEIDVLTGESTVVRADVIYQNAKSLNPALDIGQVQGAFVQCIGNMTTEEVLLDKEGRLISFGTWDYKPPTSMSIPRDFRVTLLERAPITQQGENVIDPEALAGKTARGSVVGHTAAQSSRTTGEPPFVLGTSVFFAIKHAVAAARGDGGDDAWFELDAPATVQRIQKACSVSSERLSLRFAQKRGNS